jgi:regulator of protease activity HflC (stomatin/prohibitin superfamily)
VVAVLDHFRATSQISQTTLRSVLGQSNLDDLLSEREQINAQLQQIIDEQTEPWGVKVSTVEVKDVELPQSMQRAMARQAEAERERRAKIIHAEGEQQASERLAEAGRIMAAEPATLQLRFLQTLSEVAAEKNSTIVFPVPVDLLNLVLTSTNGAGDGGRPRVRVGGGGGGEAAGGGIEPASREGTVS